MKRAIYLIILVTPLLLGFVSEPVINDGEQPVTDQDLVCEWDEPGDQTVTWYKGSTTVKNETASTSSTILSDNTTKQETWTCEVNASGNISSDNATVKNSPPSEPDLYYNGTNEGTTITLYEDTQYNLTVNSTDVNDDELEYGVQQTSFCDITVNASTGDFSCTPTYPDETDGINTSSYEVEFTAKETNSEQGFISFSTINFTVEPINKQPTIETSLQDTYSIGTGSPWSQVVSASDRENDNISFSLSTNLTTQDNSSGFILTTVNSTAVNVTPNTSDDTPERAWEGNWSVTITVSDNTSNLTPNNESFTVEINANNRAPEFTTSFNTTATQQGNLFTFTVNATDNDTEDNLTFSINPRPGSPNEAYCNQASPWTLDTINNSNDNATARINQTMTNDHVICRDVRFTVEDTPGSTDTEDTVLNITNVNDPPTIHNTSTNGSINNITTYRYVPTTYHVNASDIDNRTYNANQTANLTYNTNNSAFPINNESTITINATQPAGNYTVNVSVSDGTTTVAEDATIQLKSNTPPQTEATGNTTYSQSDDRAITVNVTDDFGTNITLDKSIPSSLLAAETNTTTTTQQGNVTKTWTYNYTPTSTAVANKQVGDHTVTYTATDSVGASTDQSSDSHDLTITNEPDGPTITTTSVGTVVINTTKNATINQRDYDYHAETANESLSLDVLDSSDNVVDPNVSEGTVSQATKTSYVVFNTTTLNPGWIEVRTTDSTGRTDETNISFSVLNDTRPPNMTEVKPYMEDGAVIDAFTNDTSNKTMNFSENTTLVFDANATPIPEIVNGTNNTLNYTYTYDGATEKTVTATPGSDTSWQQDFDYFSAGDHTVTLTITDQRLSTTEHAWNIDVDNVNRPPVLKNPLEDVETNRSIVLTDYFSNRKSTQFFYDPDDDLDGDGVRSIGDGENTSLTYSRTDDSQCSDLVDLAYSNDDLDITTKQAGTCYVKFQATDPAGATAESNVVLINITGSQTQSDDTSSSSGGGGGGGSSSTTTPTAVPVEDEVESPEAFKLISADTVTSYVNRTMEIPITVNNTWDEALTDISIESRIEGSPNATMELSESQIDYLPTGENESLTLYLTNYREQGPYPIHVTANVSDPSYEDTTTIQVNSLESAGDGDSVFTRVSYARDLLGQNPECQEFNELIRRADKAITEGRAEDARELSEAVIDGCRETLDEQQRETQVGSYLTTSTSFIERNATPILIASLALIGVSVASYSVLVARQWV